ncbi:TldD/PmbA family protein [Candidatus Micrarchaeota archaeon]|nr:TldD/PmbA family protein [Candidatus Micrarchaeota archaeon]
MIKEYEKILKQKLQSGEIQGYEVYYSEKKSFTLISELNRIKRNEWDYDHGVGIRVLVKNKIGFSSGQNTTDAQKVVNNAISVSKFNHPNKEFSFSPNAQIPITKHSSVDINSEDSNLKKLKEYISNCISTENHLMSSAMLAFQRSKLVNSEGLDVEEPWDSTVALSTDMKKNSSSIYDYLVLPNFSERFFDLPKKVKEKTDLSDKGSQQSYDGVIIIDTEALHSLLDFYLSSAEGARKHFKTTKFEIDQQVGDKKLTILDDPLDSRATARANYDGEGVASKSKEIITNGKLNLFAYNREYAALDNLDLDKYQGFCARGSYSSSPGIGFSNISLKPGRGKFEDFDKVAVVESVFGLHTANPVSGKFGLPINNGYILEKGKKTGIKDVMLSGNIFEGLKNIVSIAKEPVINDSYITPWIAVEGWHIV